MKTIKMILAGLLAALTLCTLAVGSAQAASLGWSIEGETFAELELEEEEVSVAGESLVLSISEPEATISCEKVEGSGSLIATASSKVTVELGECAVEPAGCTVKSITLKVKIEPVEIGSYFYYKVESLEEGKPLATISASGKECILPEKGEITGTAAAEAQADDFAEHPVTFSGEISEKANEELEAEEKSAFSLMYGKQAATLSGEFTLALSGANTSQGFQIFDGTGYLCTAAERECAAGNMIVLPSLKAENEVETEFSYGNLIAKCAVSKLEGSVTAPAAGVISIIRGTFTAVTFNTCGANCGVTAVNNGNQISGTNPLNFQIKPNTPLGSGAGLIRLLNLNVKIVCNTKTCNYEIPMTIQPRIDPFYIIGGTPAKFSSNGIPMKLIALGSDAACANTGSWRGVNMPGLVNRFKITEPATLYVTFT